jgi:[NiFe] hydrogenase large subunit/hydrogenase large subunit
MSALNSTLVGSWRGASSPPGLARAALEWLDALEAAPEAARRPWTLPRSGAGVGRVEVPRGALVHRIRTEGNRVAAHDYLTLPVELLPAQRRRPCAAPWRQALLDTPRWPTRPRPWKSCARMHAFDPCNACVVLVRDADSAGPSRARQMIPSNRFPGE